MAAFLLGQGTTAKRAKSHSISWQDPSTTETVTDASIIAVLNDHALCQWRRLDSDLIYPRVEFLIDGYVICAALVHRRFIIQRTKVGMVKTGLHF